MTDGSYPQYPKWVIFVIPIVRYILDKYFISAESALLIGVIIADKP